MEVGGAGAGEKGADGQILNEKPLGPFNLEQLKFYSNKKK